MKNYGRDKIFDMITSNIDDEVIMEELDQTDDVNHTDKWGLSYLHVAVLNFRRPIVELLLKKGARVDPVDHRGNTPLSYAIGKKNKEAPSIIKVLLEYGANLDFKIGEYTIRETIIMFNDPELMQFIK